METVDHIVMKHFLKVKNNQMTCQYCDNTCIKGSKDRKRYWWWECKPCKVNFLTSLKGTIDIIEFESKEENDKFYTLHITIKKNRTEIWSWAKYIKPPTNYGTFIKSKNNQSKQFYTSDFIIGFDQLLEITPQNLESKMKTYLLFL